MNKENQGTKFSGEFSAKIDILKKDPEVVSAETIATQRILEVIDKQLQKGSDYKNNLLKKWQEDLLSHQSDPLATYHFLLCAGTDTEAVARAVEISKNGTAEAQAEFRQVYGCDASLAAETMNEIQALVEVMEFLSTCNLALRKAGVN